MRTCYRRELKKKEKSEKSGASGDNMYEPTLWYFDLLHDFLGDQEIQIPGDSNLDESDDQGIGNTVNTKRKMRATHDTTKDQYLQKAVEHLDFIKEQKLMKDEAATYADSWAVSYRKLNEIQKFYAKKAIDEILIMGQLNQLTLDSVSLSSSTRAFKP